MPIITASLFGWFTSSLFITINHQFPLSEHLPFPPSLSMVRVHPQLLSFLGLVSSVVRPSERCLNPNGRRRLTPPPPLRQYSRMSVASAARRRRRRRRNNALNL